MSSTAVLSPETQQTEPHGRPITPDDLFKLNIVSDPQPSPDGTMIAYVVTRLDKDADTYKAAIWLAPADPTTGSPRQLTSGLARDTTPRWSPDGKRIAFVSNRPGEAPKKADDEKGDKDKKANGDEKPKNQIWVINVEGGEATQLTRQPNGASSPTWSPDGQTIAFLSVTSAEEDAKAQGHDEPAKRTVADERLVTDIEYRFDGRGYLDKRSHVFTVPASGGEAKQLTFGPYDDGSIAWAPDGSRIAFISARTPDAQLVRRSLVYVVPVGGGEIRCLTGEQVDFAFDLPAFSPDGSQIAVIGTNDPRAGGAKNDNLWIIPAGGGAPVNRTAHWDRSFGDAGMSDVFVGSDVRPTWTSDGQAVLMLASDSGATHVYRVDLSADQADVTPVTSGPRRITSFAPLGGDPNRLVVTSGEPHKPFELFIAANGNLTPLTHHNDAFLEEVRLSPAEEIWFQSAAGDRQIQGWILTPPGFKAGSGVKHPAIIQIHGGPHAMYGWAMFHEMQLMAARGYVVMFTNPRGSAGYGEEFTTCTRGAWGETDMPDILGALDALIARGDVDPARVGVTGGSYGGYLTNWVIGHTDRFKAAVTQRCVSNFYSFYGTSDIGWTFGEFEFGGTPWADAEKLLKYSPISYVDNIHTPLLIIHNEKDLRCPIEQAEQLFTFLKRLGREVEFVRIPDEDHNLSRTGTPSRRLARLHHLVGWFDRYL